MKIRLFRDKEHKTTNNFEEVEADVHVKQPVMKAGVLYTFWYMSDDGIPFYHDQREILNLDA